MSEWSDVRKKLPKAKLLAISIKKGRSFYARFRCANFMRLDIGRITLLVRMPWLEESARKIYPHMFAKEQHRNDDAEQR